MSNTGKGALAGGALGAGTGAIISKATGGNAGPGAVVGGLIGAVAGGAIGNEHDRREKEALFDRARQAEDRAAAASTQLGMGDVMQLAKDGHADDVIINQIRTTNSTYQLSTEDLRMLRANQVSDRVIVEMQSRRADAPRHPRYVAVPGGPPVIYAPARPIYVVSPPPPGFHVGVHVHD
jgi:surface antigen